MTLISNLHVAMGPYGEFYEQQLLYVLSAPVIWGYMLRIMLARVIYLDYIAGQWWSVFLYLSKIYRCFSWNDCFYSRKTRKINFQHFCKYLATMLWHRFLWSYGAAVRSVVAVEYFWWLFHMSVDCDTYFYLK